MKHLFLVIVIVCFGSPIFAQELLSVKDSRVIPAPNTRKDTSHIVRICCGVPNQHPALIIVKAHQQTFVSDTLFSLNADGIERINVLKDEAAIKEYGEAAKYGVVIITLKDEKYSNNLNEFKGHLKKIES